MATRARKDGFLAALTGLEGLTGNKKLCETLGWNEDTYDEVRQALIDDGTIAPRRERGGSVAIAEQGGPFPAAAKTDRANRPARPKPSAELWRMADALRGGITAKSNRASREIPEKYVVADGDFLFSWSGSLLAKFWTEGEGALNQNLFKVTSDRYPAE